jgi:hypothetical protein
VARWISRQRALHGQRPRGGKWLLLSAVRFEAGLGKAGWRGDGLIPDHKMVGQRVWTLCQEQSDSSEQMR